MSTRTLFSSWLRRLRGRKSRRPAGSWLPRVEQLEARELLSAAPLLAAHRHGHHHRPLPADRHVAAAGQSFAFALPNGMYQVTLTEGSAQGARGPGLVVLQGAVVEVMPRTAAGHFVQQTAAVAVTDGQLRLWLKQLSSRTTFALSGLTISPLATAAATGSVSLAPLTASAGPNKSGSEGSAVTFSGSAHGGTAPYAYAWNFGDGTTATGTTGPSHRYGKDGHYTVTVTVTDAAGHTATSTTTATIAEVAPTATITGAPASGHSPEGTAITLGSQVTDAGAVGTPTFSYAWTVTRNGSPFASGSGASLTFTPDDTGTYVVSLTATDGDGDTSAPATTTIIADDVAPTAAITGAPASGKIAVGAPVTLGSHVTDPSTADAAAGFTYAWTVTKNGSAFASGTSATLTFTPNAAGTYVVTLTATDGDPETSAPAQVTLAAVTATPVTANAGPAQSGQEGTAVRFSGSATGGTAPYTYAWTFGDGGTGSGASPSHTYDAEGTYTATLTVTDALGTKSTSTTTATVAEVPPTATITGAPATGHSPEGSAITLGSQVTDPSVADTNAGFTYAWSVTKNGSAFASGTAANFTFTPDDTGTYVVTLTASDKDGNKSAPATTTITADDVAPAVAINGAPAQATPGTTIALTSTVTDPASADAAGGFTYAWSVTKDGSAFASGTAANFSFTPDTAATYVVTLTVTDQDPESATAQQTIVVGSATTAPILLPNSELTRLRQEAANNTPQWQAFKASLDSNLPVILNEGSYAGSELEWIASYALGYQILQTSDPVTAANYADKAIALMKSAMSDYQIGSWEARQFLARGDGQTATFTLPNSDVIPSSLRVYLAPVTTVSVVHGGTGSSDPVGIYDLFLKASNTPDGPADYQQGTDWRHSDQADNLIAWSSTGSQPAAGATYYVTLTSGQNATRTNYTLSGNTITLATPPAANQAVLVEYVYGKHAADGSTLAYQQTSAGDGGFDSVIISDGYTARYLGKDVGLGLDWLDGYAGLTTALKNQTIDLLTQWVNWQQAKGLASQSPASNYGAGGYVSLVITALALDHRSSNGPALLTEALTYRQTNVVPLLTNPTNSLYGGFWAEGWNYGKLATEGLLLGGLALEESGQISSASAERHWASQVIDDLVSAQATPATVYDAGDWYAYPAPFPNPKDVIDVLGAMADDSAARSYANYIIQNYAGATRDPYVDLLFRDPSAPASYWSALPLQDFASGTGLLTARSDWGSDPTWVSLQMGNLLNASHQYDAPGMMEIRRGADELLINGNAPGGNQTPSTKSIYSNTVVVDDGGAGTQTYPYAMGMWYGTPGVVVNAYQAASNYVYMSGDYHAAYSNVRNPGAGGPTSELNRQLVYLRPGYVIVYDRVTTLQASFTKQLRWSFLNAPTVSGNSFVEAVGSSKLFGQSFSTLPLATIVAPATVAGVTIQQVITQNATPSASVRYVTAFQVGASTTAAMDPTQHIVSTDQRMEGVMVGNQVVLFGRNGDVDTSTPVTYQITGSGTVTHLLTNLKAGQSYQVVVNGTVTTTVTASSQGTISFTTAPAGTQTITIQQGG